MADPAALTAQLLQIQRQAYEEQLLASPRYAAPGNLARFQHQAFSQHGEHGITTRTFVECGVGNGLENNTVYLLQQGWRGACVDGSEKQVAGIRTAFARQIDQGRLSVARALVTTENVEQVFAAVGVQAQVDLLSLDIDCNTYWVWEALTSIRPRVVVIEYNAQYPPPVDWIVEYRAERAWKATSYFGASLCAYERLAREKEYALVG